MKMFVWFRSVSTVHEVEEQERNHYEEENLQSTYPRNRINRSCGELGSSSSSSCSSSSSTFISLTVWRKSLVLNCNGFTVIDDSNGNLVYRVDNYNIGRPNQVILMDASGNSILTLCRRRKFGLLDRWLMYEGELGNKRQQHPTRRRSNVTTLTKNPICCVRKCVNILQGKANVQACVYRTSCSNKRRRCVAFTIEGLYRHRTCKVLDECKKVVAEIKRKEANTKNVSFGTEIFQLVVYPGLDPAFAMALVLLLDQMFY